MAVWVVNCPEYHYPSWSFGLTVFAVTMNITAAILLIPDVREYDYKDLLKVIQIVGSCGWFPQNETLGKLLAAHKIMRLLHVQCTCIYMYM